MPTRARSGFCPRQPYLLQRWVVVDVGNVRRDDEVALVDFEEAQWRQVARDVAHLSVPCGSCVGASCLPNDQVTTAITRYRALVSVWLCPTSVHRHSIANCIPPPSGKRR